MEAACTLLSAPHSLSTSLPLVYSPFKFLTHFRNTKSFNNITLNSFKFRPVCVSSLHATATQETVEVDKTDSQFVEIGYISSVHGLQGEVRVKPNTDFPEMRLSEPGKRWLKQQLRGKEIVQEVELEEGRGHHGQKSWIVKFSNVDKIEQAQQLVGSTILVLDEDRPELDEGDFYARDLVGMRVTHKETGEPVGTVVNVFDNGGSDLLQVKLDSSLDIIDKNGSLKSESPLVWVPFVEAIVPHVDMDKREMLITPPKGLLELNVRSDERSKKERRQLEWKERKKIQKRLIAAKKKLCEMEQKHVFDGLRYGEKAQRDLLADQIVGVNSQLLQVALQTIETPSDRWQLSEFLAAYNTETAGDVFKVSKSHLVSGDVELTSSKVAERRSALISNGKVANILVLEGTKMQDFSNSEGTDNLVRRLVEMENHDTMPLILVCPVNTIDALKNLMADNDYFGFDPEKVWLLEEEKLPVVSSLIGENNKRKILMKSPWEVLQTPVGSGGVISLLSSHNILGSLATMGVEYIEISSVDQKYVGGENLLGLVESSEAPVGIKTFDGMDGIDDDFYLVFSMNFATQLTKRINGLLFDAVLRPNDYVELVDKEWVDVTPSSHNSYEFRSSIYTCLKGCSLDKIRIMEVID
ncbi:16S rRNA processing protein RimM [Artemisia annua]|uniref:16S rRNA processing protein RimM n=1 Tax=Artemisia annua TaxID=35608 RepID=A0A2U1PP53_ARTAN|nr:16S rRNA processing protein RimM [Artemisia annua]